MIKKNYFLLSILVLLLSLTFILGGCEKEEQITPEPSVTIPSSTKIISDSDWESNVTSIDASDYTFTANSILEFTYNLQEGDIIVSSVGEGYLRKISNITKSNGQVVIETVEASLTDAVEKGSVEFNHKLSSDEMTIEYLSEGTEISKDKLSLLSLTINEEIYEGVNITGNFDIACSLTGEFEISYFDIESLDIRYTIEEDLNLDAEVTLVNSNLSKEKLLAELNFNTFIVMLGGLPVTITPVLELYAGANLNANSTITTGISQEFEYEVGLLYKNSAWSDYQNVTKSIFNYDEPTLSASLSSNIYIKPRLSFKIYGTVAPYLTAKLYGELNADIYDNPWWTLDAGISADVGVYMKVFSIELFDYNTNVFHIRKNLANANGAF